MTTKEAIEQELIAARASHDATFAAMAALQAQEPGLDNLDAFARCGGEETEDRLVAALFAAKRHAAVLALIGDLFTEA
jgi:hypothetical protein